MAVVQRPGRRLPPIGWLIEDYALVWMTVCVALSLAAVFYVFAGRPPVSSRPPVPGPHCQESLTGVVCNYFGSPPPKGGGFRHN